MSKLTKPYEGDGMPFIAFARRSTRTGYVGPWSNFTGTPRQLSTLGNKTEPKPRTFASGAAWGAVVTFCVLVIIHTF